MNRFTVRQINLFIAFAGILLFIPFLGSVNLFDWDEINFAEAAREMLVTGDYLTVQIDYYPFWEKPPLFIWMQVLAMKIFGINEFAARFPNAACGVITLLILFNIGRKLISKEFGIIWSLVYAGSILSFVYFKSGIIDPWFNLFIFLGLHFMVLYSDDSEIGIMRKRKAIILSAFFIGLGIMTKGPAALLIFSLCVFVFLIIRRFRVKTGITDVFLWLAIAGLTGSLWFIFQILNGNTKVVVDFIIYQIRLFQTEDAGHGGFFGYHFVVLLLGMFPASVFALKAFWKKSNEDIEAAHFRQWMLILFWVVLILFSIVKTKIVHYSSLCYFPLTFLAAWAIHRIFIQKARFGIWQKVLIIVFTLLWAIVVTALPIIDSYKTEIISSGIVKDKFAMANLCADAGWSLANYIIGAVFLIMVILSIMMKNVRFKIYGLLISVCLFTAIVMILVIPKVEKYTQNAAIEFYKNHSDETCYIKTFNFKSYANLFYGGKKFFDGNIQDEQKLMGENIPIPVYLVVKIQHKDDFQAKYRNVAFLYEKNGFVFYKKNQ